MAVPKRRMSRSNTRSRRSQWKATRTELVGVTVAGQQHKVPRRLLKAARLGLIDLSLCSQHPSQIVKARGERQLS